MIKNRLASLIAERGLNITRVSKETGISRNSITSIAQNDSEMIRLDTINTLCRYFGITHCEFFDYDPIDLDFSIFVNNVSYNVVHSETDPYAVDEYFSIMDIDIELFVDMNNIKKDTQLKRYSLLCTLVEPMNFPLFSSSQYVHGIEVTIDFKLENEKKEFINEVYNKINPQFHQDLYNNLVNSIGKEIRDWTVNHFNNSTYTDELKDRFLYVAIEYLFIRDLHTDVFKKF